MTTPVCPESGDPLEWVESTNSANQPIGRWECSGSVCAYVGPWHVNNGSGWMTAEVPTVRIADGPVS